MTGQLTRDAILRNPSPYFISHCTHCTCSNVFVPERNQVSSPLHMHSTNSYLYTEQKVAQTIMMMKKSVTRKTRTIRMTEVINMIQMTKVVQINVNSQSMSKYIADTFKTSWWTQLRCGLFSILVTASSWVLCAGLWRLRVSVVSVRSQGGPFFVRQGHTTARAKIQPATWSRAMTRWAVRFVTARVRSLWLGEETGREENDRFMSAHRAFVE